MRLQGDWSSAVCSSDLSKPRSRTAPGPAVWWLPATRTTPGLNRAASPTRAHVVVQPPHTQQNGPIEARRSEERRVGEEWSARWGWGCGLSNYKTISSDT